MRVTLHTGPRGGVEYRLHDDARGTFRVVSRYVARPYMTPALCADADAMEAARRDATRRKAADEATWRAIQAGRSW